MERDLLTKIFIMANRFSAGEEYYDENSKTILESASIGEKYQNGCAIYEVIEKDGKLEFKFIENSREFAQGYQKL